MNINISPAEVGAIVYALQSVYSESSSENQISDSLCKSVYEHFESLGSSDRANEMYERWLDEFEII